MILLIGPVQRLATHRTHTGRHHRSGRVRWGLAIALCAWPIACERNAPESAPTPDSPSVAVAISEPEPSSRVGKIASFRATAVDGSDSLVLIDGQATVAHLHGPPTERPRTHVVKAFPKDSGYRAVIRNQRGRAVVRVVQQPTPQNGHRLRVIIDDSFHPGAEPLDFDIYAVQSSAPTSPYNVIVITIDTLRRDRLGCYGYHRPISPNIDRFAERCVRFTGAHSTSSFTPPAHASIFTSRYVADHGLLTWNPLGDDQITLAEVLKDAGYLTIADANLRLLSKQNLGQGFDFRDEGPRDGRILVRHALSVVRNPPDQPFFLWIHLYDPHRPYAHEASWRRRYNPEGREGVGDGEEHYNLLPEDVEKQGLSEADLVFIEDRYDGGVAFTDAILGPLLEKLSSSPRLDDTIVVITSDHGENLREHPERLFAHDPFLYPVVTDIPLLIRYPREEGAGRTTDATVSLIDIAPTILDVIGLSSPPTFDGLSLTSLTGSDQWQREGVFMECWGWAKRKAIHTGDRLVMYDLETEETSFFDLSKDPACKTPAGSPGGEVDIHLRERLLGFIAERAHSTVEPPELDEETIRHLRSLGYID